MYVFPGSPPDTGMSRNPFGVMDVPDPLGAEALAFAAQTVLSGGADDANAMRWAPPDEAASSADGIWSSRWNGGADPSMPGDTPEAWKVGRGELCTLGDRVYCYFDWDSSRRRGLIEALQTGNGRLIGRYVNITDPRIVRPWVGLIVSPQRIDGRWSGGRLDFRR